MEIIYIIGELWIWICNLEKFSSKMYPNVRCTRIYYTSTIDCHEGLIFPLTEQHPTDKEFSLNKNRRNANASLGRLQSRVESSWVPRNAVESTRQRLYVWYRHRGIHNHRSQRAWRRAHVEGPRVGQRCRPIRCNQRYFRATLLADVYYLFRRL